MNDLTILYYTANTIPEITGQKVRDYLLKVTENQFPIISVSQKPLNFGQNICVGLIGRSKYNCYKQILIGVKEVKTKYVACAEDDTLYAMDHFAYRPREGIFSYENNMWFAEENCFWRWENINNRSGMWGCIATTETLPNKFLFWGEPGYHDRLYGMQNRFAQFESENPTVVFRYRESMGGFKGGRREVRTPENITYNLESFGGINKLWRSYWA